jgi:hypothetical protein
MADRNTQLIFGFVGKQISPADNLDVFDTIAPLWQNRDLLSAQEKSLVYAIAVLEKQIGKLGDEIYRLRQQVDPNNLHSSGRKKK